jgi:hypothetical protein
MRNPVIVAHKRIIRRQWVEALATQAAGHAAMVVAVASIFATGAYALSSTLDAEKRTRPPVVVMGLLLAVAGALGSKALAAEADSDWAYFHSLRSETALIVANAARWESEQNWGRNTALGTVAGGVSTVPTAVSAAPGEALQWFNWQDLADADQHPVLAMVGGMGAGKTRLAKYIARHVVARPGERMDAIAFDLYANVHAWEGFECVWDHAEMVAQMEADLDLLSDRAADYRKGKRDFTPVFRAFDESKFSIPQIRKLGKAEAQTLESWQDQYGSVTRKIRARVCYLNTSLTSEALGMSADDRGDVTIIFPGEKGIAKAMQDSRMLKLGTRANLPLRQQLTAALEQIPEGSRPALVFHDGNWYPAAIPQLDEHGNPPGVSGAVPVVSSRRPPQQADDPREQLERLFKVEAPRPALPREESKLSRLIDYIRRNGPVKRRAILQKWARNHDVSAQLLDQMLETLQLSQTVVVASQGYEITGNDT